MKVEITVKWGAASKTILTVYKDWSTEKLYEIMKKIFDLVESE